MRKRRCLCCSNLFRPDPRVRSRQKVCRKPECQAKRKKQGQRQWSAKNKDYWLRRGDGEAQKALRSKNASYMRAYRASHPEYVAQDNKRRNGARRGRNTAEAPPRRNQDEISEQLQDIKRLIVELLPCRKQDVICRQMPDSKDVVHDLPAP